MSEAMRKIPKRERTIPSGYNNPPVHAAKDNQAEMRFARGAATSGTEPAGANRG